MELAVDDAADVNVVIVLPGVDTDVLTDVLTFGDKSCATMVSLVSIPITITTLWSKTAIQYHIHGERARPDDILGKMADDLAW